MVHGVAGARTMSVCTCDTGMNYRDAGERESPKFFQPISANRPCEAEPGWKFFPGGHGESPGCSGLGLVLITGFCPDAFPSASGVDCWVVFVIVREQSLSQNPRRLRSRLVCGLPFMVGVGCKFSIIPTDQC